MAEETRHDLAEKAMSLTPRAADDSSPESIGDMKKAMSGFIAARMELIGIEAKEAAGFAAKKATHGVILAICGFFIWCLVLTALTGILAPVASGYLEGSVDWLPGWCAVLLVLALLHTVVALVCVIRLRKKPTDPLFALSRQELENDKQWLKKNR